MLLLSHTVQHSRLGNAAAEAAAEAHHTPHTIRWADVGADVVGNNKDGEQPTALWHGILVLACGDRPPTNQLSLRVDHQSPSLTESALRSS